MCYNKDIINGTRKRPFFLLGAVNDKERTGDVGDKYGRKIY
jgi:hypothetical protein|uniref:Uncharacterized protein n=1 Tax=Myoviridae sp. ctMnh10 TaxID=2827682 RepID=A0A8S5TI61_9CAUD|nr:MAG TPA: hypothetical protein [Myoviridae sp. ctMnh10]DAO10295.1 MAG TPA: hypothetical protein [Caudoviricetes sp.]DAX54183.1 MAG TPA: hypothetical protein [Caudoviricetes sp.]